MAFIAGKTNRSISNKLPKEYLAEIIAQRGEKTILDQYVPIDPDLIEIDNYRLFLEKRRDMLTNLVNRFVESFSD